MGAGSATAGLLVVGTCLGPSTPSEVATRLQAAESAFASLDDQAFARSLEDAALLLPCLDEVVSPALSASYHRMEGLRLFALGQESDAVLALRTSRHLEPAYSFPQELLSKDHFLTRLYLDLPTEEGATTRPPPPLQGALWFDGRAADRRPTERTTIFQVVSEDGRVGQTAYLRVDAPLPEYAAVRRVRNRLLVASGAAVAGSAVFGGLALANRSAFLDTTNVDLDYQDLETLQARSRVWVGASTTLLVLGVGGGVATWGFAP
jgi:hypothetical protein